MTANALSCSVRPWSRDWYIMCGVTPVVVLNSLFFFSSPFVTSFHNIWFLVIWRRHHGRPSIFFHAVGKCEDVKTQSCAAKLMVSRMIIGIQFIQAYFYPTASFYATAILSISRLFVLPLTHWQESSHCFWPLTVGEEKVYGNIRVWLMKVSMGEKNSVAIIFRSFSC